MDNTAKKIRKRRNSEGGVKEDGNRVRKRGARIGNKTERRNGGNAIEGGE
jgi:hypothetical protein